MATHSSILAWRIPWTEESDGLQLSHKELDTTMWLTHTRILWSHMWIVTILPLLLQFRFPFFFSPIAGARTSKIMLNKSNKSEHPCLIPDLRGNAFSFSPLSMMLAVGLSYVAIIMLRYFPSMHTFLRVFFIINGYWILSKAFSASFEMTIWFLFFSYLM